MAASDQIDPGQLHHDAIVVDAHSDVFCDVLERRLRGETEVLRRLHLPNWRAGGVDVVVTTLYVEGAYKPDRALQQSVALLGAALNDIEETPEVRLCRTRAEIAAALREGRIAFVLAMEGADPVQEGIEALRVFHALGLRILGLTWNQRNLLASGVGEGRLQGEQGGLTERGRQMVREANRLGILLDVSHLTVESFWDLIETSRRPVIASHSNALALRDHPRNLDDDQIKALAESGGVIGICAVSDFISADAGQASLDAMLDHLDHVARLAGVEHVALGFDFVDFLQTDLSADLGAPQVAYARGIETISQASNVTAGLLARGYDEVQIRGILGLNFLRVFVDVCG